MKKQLLIIAMASIAISAYAQTNSSSVLVRHDTTRLKADECEWILNTLTKKDPILVSSNGKSVSLLILQAIEKGKIKAYDINTNKPIPPNKIFTWNVPADTIMTPNDKGDPRIDVIQRKHHADNLDQIRVYHDWYYDVATGKLRAVIKCIDLMEQVNNSMGLFMGYSALCRIYY